MNRLAHAILSDIAQQNSRVSSARIVASLASQGIEISERTARYYLKELDRQGLTVKRSRSGRNITEKGRQELRHGFATDRVGFIINKINNLAVLTDFDPATQTGRVILNVTYVPERSLATALDILVQVARSPYTLCDRIVVSTAGERIGNLLVPEGLTAIGSVCSITLNGIMLKSGIPLTPKLGGVVEIARKKPQHFQSFISYESSSVAPLEIFAKSGMTDVLGAVVNGQGAILGSLRMIPEDCLMAAQSVLMRLEEAGLRNTAIFGHPGQKLLGIPIAEGKIGMAVLNGLNAHAALSESGLGTHLHTMATMVPFEDLKPISAYRKRLGMQPMGARVMAGGNV